MASSPLIADLQAYLAADHPSEDAFESQALALFAHQYQNNLPFQRFCQQRGKTLRTVKSWRDIPAVPISAFKALTLSCIPAEQAERTFMTSGTTQAEVKGKHHHPTLAVYDDSMIRNFRQRFMHGSDQKIRMGLLFPDESLLPNSSLAHYLALALREFGTDGSHYLLTQDGLDHTRLIAELENAQQSGEPYALLGASYSFVHLLDELQRLGKTFVLPPGSRVLDTGGFKGQSRELSMPDFYAQLSGVLGIAASQCINMYGMTELSTQFYDAGNAVLPSVKSGPHWIRTRVVEPLSGEELPRGEQGILAHCDLANFNSVTTLLTEDVGVAVDGGFLLLGRAEGSAAKGCSLAVQAFLQAATA
ncbi:long-chain fatty acid--CoA ligase [Polaromonas sp. SM01]|uniref:LuxE/PaaK family acyltransferase n=1 Tax=Polaromonas sp. SM01 TaxID=3085630 RepID=UPI002981F2AE|nr:long-chain fatty acid--CoA ligase [Polaromonas sp. SM01]MDW5442182.1 long-chain fatty acid--CoA ligase [Polaromonas sp. SM01]